jgi:hypothetical protein
MQVVDWIHSGGWSDSPDCVHPVLRVLAIRANDTLADDGRQKLLDLTPRLMGTASTDRELSIDLAIWCARQVLHIFEDEFPNDVRPRRAIEAAERRSAYATTAAAYAYATAAAATTAANAAANAAAYATAAATAATNAANADATNAANAAAYATTAAAYAAADSAQWDLLTGCLDEYDRLTGRTEVNEIEAAQWSAVCELMTV